MSTINEDIEAMSDAELVAAQNRLVDGRIEHPDNWGITGMLALVNCEIALRRIRKGRGL